MPRWTPTQSSVFWAGSRPIYAEVDARGHAMPEHPTEVRSRRIKNNLYFLLTCPYKKLCLQASPDRRRDLCPMEGELVGGLHRVRFRGHQALQGIRGLSPK